jgi:hypothetical protein
MTTFPIPTHPQDSPLGASCVEQLACGLDSRVQSLEFCGKYTSRVHALPLDPQ